MKKNDTERPGSLWISGPSGETLRSRIALIVPKALVKKIKDALETQGNLDKTVKIRPARLENLEICFDGTSFEPRPDTFIVSTRLSVEIRQSGSDILLTRWDLLRSLGLTECQADIDVITSKQACGTQGLLGLDEGCEPEPNSQESASMNPLGWTVGHWLQQFAVRDFDRSVSRDNVLSYSWTYMIYPPLLLLPLSALSNLSSIFASKDQDLPKDLSSLWALLSKRFRTSHVALNAPIQASVSGEASIQGKEYAEPNVLRSPTGLAPLYGDFGPALPVTHVPTTTDFTSAFWCTARQNGIFQTWAPRYTMFSRGNISEKARILTFKSFTDRRVGSQSAEMSAVDLYAGIGYFAFSYAKAGVSKVLCWEINPWSVEGLRRGATKNGWGVKVIKDGQTFGGIISSELRLVVSQESNEHAPRTIAALKGSIPSVRHVNCGLLPTSKDSWEVAVQVLDSTGGWIHVHENIAKADTEMRTVEITNTFKRLVMKHGGQAIEGHCEVECEHVEQVKSYAPGVMHCVLDISVLLTG